MTGTDPATAPAIEAALRQFRPEIRIALASTEARRQIDAICREHWRGTVKAG